MNSKLIISNIVFIVALFFMIGGGYYSNYGYVFMAIYLVVFFIMFPYSFSNSFLNKDSIWLYIFLLFILLTSDFHVNICIAQFVMFMPCMLIQSKINILETSVSNIKQEKYFYFVILFIFVYYCYRAFELLEDNPMALRLLISTEKDDSIVVGGGFALPYSLALLCPALFYNMGNIIKYKYKLMFSAFILLGTLLVFSSLYSTAIILLVVGFMYTLYKRIGKKYKITAFVVILTLIITLIVLLPLITEYFLSQEANVVGRRLAEINNILYGNTGNDDGDFKSRLLLSLSSIITFFDNPLFGVGPSVNYDYFKMEKLGVGSHSQWFDLFAIYGLFSILLLFYIIRRSKYVKNNNIALIMFIVLGFLNPIFFFNLIFITYYMVPMFNYLWPSKN